MIARVNMVRALSGSFLEEQFPGAIQIVDLYHARQHLWDLGGKLHPNDEKSKRRWVMAHQHSLDVGKIETW